MDTELSKRCSKCLRELPMSRFHLQKGKPRSNCVDCVREYAQTRRTRQGGPVCKQCGVSLPRTAYCDSCREQRKKQKRESDEYRQKRRDMAKKWRQEHKDEWKAIYTRSNQRAAIRRSKQRSKEKVAKSGDMGYH